MKNLIKILTPFIERFSEPTPKFFQKIQQTLLSLAAIIAFAKWFFAQANIEMPEIVANVFSWYTVFMAAFPALVLQLTSIWRNPDGTLNKEKQMADIEEKIKSRNYNSDL